MGRGKDTATFTLVITEIPVKEDESGKTFSEDKDEKGENPERQRTSS